MGQKSSGQQLITVWEFPLRRSREQEKQEADKTTCPAACKKERQVGRGKNEIIKTHPTLMLGEVTESFESEFHAGHLTTTPTTTEMHWKDFFSQEACQQEEI